MKNGATVLKRLMWGILTLLRSCNCFSDFVEVDTFSEELCFQSNSSFPLKKHSVEKVPLKLDEAWEVCR